MKKKSQFLSNVFSSWVVFFINIVISFFLAPFVVNSLGNTYYGVWVIMMQFTGYLHLMDFGVRESIIRYTSKYSAESTEQENRTDINNILSASVLLYSLIGVLALIISLLIAYFFSSIFNIPPETESEAQIVVVLTGITLAQFFVFNVYTGVMMGLKRFNLMNNIGIIFSLIRPVLIVVFLKLGYGIIALAVIQLVIATLNNTFIYHYAHKLLKEFSIPFKLRYVSFRKNLTTYKEIFNYSIYVLINNIGQKAIFHTDALVIGIFMSAASVTFYAIAGTLVDYLIRFCTIGVQVLNPMVSEHDTKNATDSIREIIYAGTKISLVAGMPIIIIYITMGENFIGLWMGEEYRELSGALLIMLAGMQIYSLGHYTISSALYGMSMHHIIAKLRLLEAFMNVVLSVILIQSMGLYGVALGTMIPHFVFMAIILPILVRKKVRLDITSFYLNSYLKPVLSGIPFFIVCMIMQRYYEPESLPEFFLLIIAILPIYLMSAWYFCFKKDEREKYKAAVFAHFGRK